MTVTGNTGVNTGGDPSNLIVMLHSDAGEAVKIAGTPQFTGLIYAPGADLTINGGGVPGTDNVVGAAVVRTATATGHGNLEYAAPTVSVQFETPTDIIYVHGTENRIRVTGE
jgi:hypothetical protein